jgi:hypothetical protein
MGGTHAVAAIIINAPGENAGSSPEPQRAGDSVGGEPGLHRLEQVAVNDRLMFSLVNRASVSAAASP